MDSGRELSHLVLLFLGRHVVAPVWTTRSENEWVGEKIKRAPHISLLEIEIRGTNEKGVLDTKTTRRTFVLRASPFSISRESHVGLEKNKNNKNPQL